MRNIQTAVIPHQLKLDTCLYQLIYSEYSILSPPKIFTIPPETPCIYVYTYITDEHICVVNIHDACQKHKIAHDSKKISLDLQSFYNSFHYVYFFYGCQDTVDRYFEMVFE
jgi:hypothetical protein